MALYEVHRRCTMEPSDCAKCSAYSRSQSPVTRLDPMNKWPRIMELIVALGLIVFKVAFLVAILLLLPLPLTWLERKIAGHIQQRWGGRVSGGAGCCSLWRTE